MGRKHDDSRRDELLRAATQYVHRQGLADLSLRALGENIGTPARMLIYHFGSKEGLVTAILEAANNQQLRGLTQASQPGQNPFEVIRSVWNHLIAPDLRPVLRLKLEVDILALTNPAYETFSTTSVNEWHRHLVTLFRATLDEERSELATTLILAIANGLLLDLLRDPDDFKVTQAFEAFLDCLERNAYDG